jgi:hypothetical protein
VNARAFAVTNALHLMLSTGRIRLVQGARVR